MNIHWCSLKQIAPLNFSYQNCMKTLLLIIIMSLMLAQKSSSHNNNNNNSMIIEITLSLRVYCHLTSAWVSPEGGTTRSCQPWSLCRTPFVLLLSIMYAEPCNLSEEVSQLHYPSLFESSRPNQRRINCCSGRYAPKSCRCFRTFAA